MFDKGTRAFARELSAPKSMPFKVRVALPIAVICVAIEDDSFNPLREEMFFNTSASLVRPLTLLPFKPFNVSFKPLSCFVIDVKPVIFGGQF